MSKDDAQKVVAIISGDKAKIKNYCDILKLGEQMERAYENRDLKLADELLQICRIGRWTLATRS